jgi:SAM-dependent methyltransferase
MTRSHDTIYQDDLAKIHIDGYGFHWEGAAEAVLGFFRRYAINGGTVVDLGCGGGQWLERLARGGYQVYGIDQSASMIRSARKRVPNGKLIVGSFADVVIPSCDAVTALGDPFNYLDGPQSIQRVFDKVFHALRPGGILVFDAREPATKPVEPRIAARVGENWACIARIEEDGAANSLVRDITTFRKVGNEYRRAREAHRLKVYPKRVTLRWLRDTGFRVRTFRSYGDYRLQQRQSAYVARKPK